jgi:hypothetical protein
MILFHSKESISVKLPNRASEPVKYGRTITRPSPLVIAAKRRMNWPGWLALGTAPGLKGPREPTPRTGPRNDL